MYEKEIIQILEKLNDNEKKEVLDFAEFINYKHTEKPSNKTLNKNNPLLQLAGFAEISKISSSEIDKELY